MASIETLVTFDNDTGVYLNGSLIADPQGNLYGTTAAGSANSGGTVFKLTVDASSPTGYTTSTLVSFDGTNGSGPSGGLIADGQGNFYGTTASGGSGGRGTVFKLTADAGSPTGYTTSTLASFDGDNGSFPNSSLIADGQGNLYGTTIGGGSGGRGTVFKLTADAGSSTGYTTSTLASFDFDNGASPFGSLIADGQGNLYGTTQSGGTGGGGTVFKLTADAGSPTGYTASTIVAFDGTNGSSPTGSLIADGQGNLYGTTSSGGAGGAGTVFKLTADAGSPTGYATSTLASFDGTNGGSPIGSLIADEQGNLYGTTSSGGADGAGTVFKLTADAGSSTGYTTSTLASFDGDNGRTPSSSLIADGQGNLYGTTSMGGANGEGTVFRITDTGFVCYGPGTHLRLWRGGCEAEVPVEHLRLGDLAVTASGEHRPIRWIGHRTLAPRRQREPQVAMPVRIAAHAFGQGRPARDLTVSPAHAIAVDVLGEVLIPACRLINGTTITQVEAETITYWHIELDSHDILLAEGLPSESYLDCGNRRFFANAEATDLLAGPDTRSDGPLPFCRPFHEAGPLVDLVRARLRDRAVALGWCKVEEAFAGLHLVADGRAIRPDMQGLTARFVVPASARDVRLVSETSVPAHVVPDTSDDRRLGVALAALTIDDGLTSARPIALDDARLGEGFHAVNGGARWTDGSAALPADLWAGCKGSFFLRVELAVAALPRWIAPSETAGVVNLADRRKA
ncbi:hypothetical protein ASG52_12455 [Methylobacterium sp. Leaf456]|uniref:choice-of-anchor tandem repeat GloVer-containing protein n=1 Tax=Methylobacterium sp. Leaf456 TaxID=1736382 RepID=UPI0007022709|nr:choice-of-anchor tandem repeat GloVer-containing protein [Methylobacterium sp. Leaf456]KQT46536.1 hypothetical protein ASG52_12455 [Methylobacterium sp. Leaf456]